MNCLAFPCPICKNYSPLPPLDFSKTNIFLHVHALTTMQGAYTRVAPLKIEYTLFFLKKYIIFHVVG
jgi:hypothetical protein